MELGGLGYLTYVYRCYSKEPTAPIGSLAIVIAMTQRKGGTGGMRKK